MAVQSLCKIAKEIFHGKNTNKSQMNGGDWKQYLKGIAFLLNNSAINSVLWPLQEAFYSHYS